jgi:hypothetical protein
MATRGEERTQLKVRVPEALHDALREEASRRGMTLNSLIEARLRQAGDAASVEERFGGQRLMALARGLISEMVGAGRAKMGEGPIDAFLDDPAAYAEAEGAAVRLLKQLRPKDDGRLHFRPLIDPPERLDRILNATAEAFLNAAAELDDAAEPLDE